MQAMMARACRLPTRQLFQHRPRLPSTMALYRWWVPGLIGMLVCGVALVNIANGTLFGKPHISITLVLRRNAKLADRCVLAWFKPHIMLVCMLLPAANCNDVWCELGCFYT